MSEETKQKPNNNQEEQKNDTQSNTGKSKQGDNKSSNENKKEKAPLIPPEVMGKGNVIINTSSSKQMYSFPKAERFGQRKQGYDCFYYNLPSMMSKRGTSIGYGTKVDLGKKQSGRSDQMYNIPREFDLNRSGSPKYSFGLSRDICYLPGQAKPNKSNPGPGNYSPNKPFGSDACKFSIFGRRSTDNNKTNFPGPGSYSYLQINENGRYPVSSFENSPRPGFGSAQRNFGGAYNKYPGPGSYKSQAFINGNGIVYNSNYRSNLGKSMGAKLNSGFGGSSSRTPGPGSYDFFSDFEGFNRRK